MYKTPPHQLNVTPTLRLAFSSTVHVGPDVESQSDDQLPNAEPLLGAAVSVTDVPVGKLALQVGPQLIPGGTLVTTPVPGPEDTTVRPKLSDCLDSRPFGAI
jgi:hypothetical protein